MRLALVTCLLLAGALLAGTVLASNEHEAGACTAQSWSQNTGPNEFWWKVVTACNDHSASELTHNTYLQYYNWDASAWRDRLLIFGGSRLWADFYGVSRFRVVPAFNGAACYRIKTRHLVIEWYKGGYSDVTTYSTEQCY